MVLANRGMFDNGFVLLHIARAKRGVQPFYASVRQKREPIRSRSTHVMSSYFQLNLTSGTGYISRISRIFCRTKSRIEAILSRTLKPRRYFQYGQILPHGTDYRRVMSVVSSWALAQHSQVNRMIHLSYPRREHKSLINFRYVHPTYNSALPGLLLKLFSTV